MSIILKTNDLTKKYGNKVVVDNLNIEIEEGEIFGQRFTNAETVILSKGISFSMH